MACFRKSATKIMTAAATLIAKMQAPSVDRRICRSLRHALRGERPEPRRCLVLNRVLQ